ncbi:hypothetical protein [Streptomyces sp. bgisy031]|uniref:hypothetical protein n=1 Tax=Streptomyces sp. bgisy031 TaxID=3413772 RepID=UPI003D75C77E
MNTTVPALLDQRRPDRPRPVPAVHAPHAGPASRDLAGLTDRRIADAYASGDLRALRDRVLRVERPELLHVHAVWVDKAGLTVARLADAGYVPLYRQRNGGDFVRADAVHDPARIAAVRAWATPRLDRLIADQDHTGGCGATLTPGQGAAL